MKLVKTANGKTTIKMSKSEWVEMGKKAGWISKKAQSAYDRWKTSPPEDYEGPDCPDCDGLMESDGDSWKCLDEDCNGYIDNERDYEPDYDEGGYFGRWGPE